MSTAALQYTVEELRSLTPSAAHAWDVNTAGVAVGGAYVDQRSRAVRWDGAMPEDLGLLRGCDQGELFAVNDTGQIAGECLKTGLLPLPHAVLFNNGTRTRLGALPGHRYSSARDINEAGHVVGYSFRSYVAPNSCRAFLFDGTRMIDLGTLGGGSSQAYGISNPGEVVGSSGKRGASRAFLWRSKKMTDLGTLGGKSSCATAVNDSGTIVGWSLDESSDQRPCRWSDGNAKDLGMLAGYDSGEALGINGSGVIVGTCSDEESRKQAAFIYVNGKMTDLNACHDAPDWKLTHATAINDAGVIVGFGDSPGKARRAFIARPVRR